MTTTCPSYSTWLHSPAKRWGDLTFCALATAPAMIAMLLIALAVLLRDGWPIVLRQPRMGMSGKPFQMWKFRTMRPGAGDDECRITSLGRFLRRHRLDELPQLFAVIAGTMSVVGPRPELAEIASGYGPLHRQRLVARPGLTGLWQIRGSRRKAIHEQIEYDLLYLSRASPCMDMWLVARTIWFILAPKTWQI